MSGGSLQSMVGFLRRLAAPADLAGLADADLVRLFASSGDEAAFALLVRRHGPVVLGALRRQLPRAEDVEDAFQATFLVLARRAGAIGRPEAVSAFLYGVALRIARKARRRRPAAPLPEDLADSAPAGDDELAALVDEELDRLPEKYRIPIVLCCVEGLSREEAARRLGQSEGAVKGLLERGRQRLREQLDRRGVPAGLFPAALPAAPVPAGLEAAAVGVVGGAAPAAVAALAQGALTMTNPLRWKTLSALLLVGVACSGVGLAVGPEEPAARPPAPRAAVAAPDPEPQADAPKPAAELDAKAAAVAFSPDGRVLVTGGRDGKVVLWDVPTGKELARLDGHKKGVTGLAVLPDGKTLVTGGAGGSVLAWDLAARRLLWKSAGGAAVTALALAPDGSSLASAAGGNQVLRWETATGRPLPAAVVGDPKEAVHSVAFSPDGKRLLAGGQVTLNRGTSHSEFHVLDVATLKELARATGAPRGIDKLPGAAAAPAPVAYSPDGRTWAGGASDGQLFLGGKPAATGHKRGVAALAFTPDGKTLLSVGRGGVLLFTDVASAKESARVAGLGKVAGLALAPGGGRLALAREDGKVALYDLDALVKAAAARKP
jgi:RNA polymerase sigma factor (sigma-70 family)